MKNIYRIILALGLCWTSVTMTWAEVKDTLTIAPFTASPGVTAQDGKSFSIMMSNNDSIWGIQFEIRLPEGMGFASEETPFTMNEKRFPQKTNGETKSFRHTLLHHTLADGWTRVLIYSLDTKLYISGKSGEILRVAYTTDATLPDTTCSISLRNVYLAINGAKDSKPKDADTPVDIRAYVQGDANGDGQVDILDVIAVISLINGSTDETLVKEAANINGDEEINILDVIGILEIMNKETTKQDE